MKTIPNDVIAVLDAAEKDGIHLRLVGQLERKLYTAVNKVIVAAGGQWDKKAQAHIFADNAADAIEPLILTGEYADPKQDFGQFDTPPKIVDKVIEAARIKAGMSVLEPSAGQGRLAIAAVNEEAFVTCVEIDQRRAEALQEAGDFEDVFRSDFLTEKPSDINKDGFDRVIMNPPFAKGADIEHVRHAFTFLKPGGRLVAIMSPGWTFRKDKKFSEFRDWARSHGAESVELPANAFAESGTKVRTVLFTVDKVS